MQIEGRSQLQLNFKKNFKVVGSSCVTFVILYHDMSSNLIPLIYQIKINMLKYQDQNDIKLRSPATCSEKEWTSHHLF
jgi:hypothetical protein